MKKWNLVVGNKAKAKVLSVLLAVTMSFSLFGCGQTASDKSNEEASAAASEVEAEADAAASEAKATPSHSSESGKDETVYIVTDASGNPTNITVNDQLKNKDGAATLVDKTDLKDIVNVNGDGSYTENSDGTITWETESADVYERRCLLSGNHRQNTSGHGLFVLSARRKRHPSGGSCGQERTREDSF